MKKLLLFLLISSNVEAQYYSEEDYAYFDTFYRQVYNLNRYNSNNYVPGNPFFFPIMGQIQPNLLNSFNKMGVNCQTMSKPDEKGIVFSIVVCR